MPLYYFIDESGNDDKSRFFMLSAIALYDYEKLSKYIKDEEEKIRNSVYFGKFDDFKYFHASSDSLDVRSRFIESIREFNYRSYFVIIDKEKADFKHKEKAIYSSAVKYLFRNILIKNKNKENYLYFEECSIMKLGDYRRIIEKMSSEINKKYDVNPIININIKKKVEEPLLAITDYMLYILQETYNVGGKIEHHVINQYDILSDKIGMIHDLCDNKFYDKRHPFEIK